MLFKQKRIAYDISRKNSVILCRFFSRPLAKVVFATESTEKMSFKSFLSKVSVCSVADSLHLCKKSSIITA
jgi:hypothetical protein